MTAEGNEEAVLTQQENFENETSESENFEIDTMQTESSPLMKKVYTEYTAKGKQCSREENEELYKNAEMLLKMRTSLNFELLSSPTAILNFEQEIEVDNHIYYLLDNEEITGWDYYEKRAEEIYDRE
ncbi:MAG: hypothetical protein LUG83_05180 [Lachnospiraceae bacterium]|nr:hypothetical protein [Lachnospiraceae bacterium]